MVFKKIQNSFRFTELLHRQYTEFLCILNPFSPIIIILHQYGVTLWDLFSEFLLLCDLPIFFPSWTSTFQSFVQRAGFQLPHSAVHFPQLLLYLKPSGRRHTEKESNRDFLYFLGITALPIRVSPPSQFQVPAGPHCQFWHHGIAWTLGNGKKKNTEDLPLLSQNIRNPLSCS